jgi:patatin-like phospholipase
MADGEPEAEKTQSPLGTLVEQSRAQGWVDQSWGSQHHDDVVAPEIEAINTRREEGRPLANPGSGKMLDVVGLALSGGGIRSSAVCLGVLQALNHHDLIKRIDYLSTVSGGGYIGASLSATMTIAKRFVFGATPVSATGQPLSSEISDTPEVGHIRNYSNYLIPAGMRDVLTGIAIVVRGLVANVGLTLPFVVLLAAITAASNPVRSCLYTANFFGFRVDDGSLIPSMLKRVPLIATLGFTYAGIVLALLLLLFREIGYRLSSPELRSRNVPVGYAAGIAVVIGVICDIARYLPVDNFGLTLAACMIGLLLFFIWALVRSFLRPENLQEFRGHLPTMGATFLVLLAAIAFLEFQPFIIGGMFDVADASSGQSFGLVTGIAIGWIKSLAAITAPIAAVVTLFRQQFGELLKGAASSQWTSQIMAYLAKGALWLAGTALPLLIWIGFIYLSYWAIANDKVLDKRLCDVDWPAPGVIAATPKAPASLTGKIQFDSGAKTLTAEIAGKPPAQPEAKPGPPKPPDPMEHSPGWLTSAAKYTFGEQGLGLSLRWSLVDLYLLFAAMLFVLSWQLKPNANSLHRLYRDRLSKAFLFAPVRQHRTMARNDPSLDQGRDYPELDDYQFKLSWLYPPTQANPPTRKLEAPYHLINAALNIQGSDFANRRGRNADFFLFSPLRVGSEATGYEETQIFEDKEKGLDLATAMAISGAAASSNMGSNSIRALTPTLALLNIRLGYWLKNPRYIADDSQPVHRSTLYLWSEISGRLYENSDAVYLTDGGHIENLGVYELLRRRCKVIIAVDAEADAPMNFSSLMTLQRYARIDLGILIDLPWSPIRTCTLSVMDRNAGKPPPSPPPPEPDRVHVAIGTIDYGGGEKGYLVYIKSSLTGNENDYIRDYARRNDRFPHETTGDQFFSEEQFEVYRALGFNMAHGFLDDAPDAREVVVNTETERCVKRKFSDTGVAAIREVRAALGLAVPAADSTSEGEDTEA